MLKKVRILFLMYMSFLLNYLHIKKKNLLKYTVKIFISFACFWMDHLKVPTVHRSLSVTPPEVSKSLHFFSVNRYKTYVCNTG